MIIQFFLIFFFPCLFELFSSGASVTNWTPAEDQLLLSAVAQHGAKKWSTIADHISGRKGKQCRERYMNHLDPTIDKSDLSVEEETLLTKLVPAHTIILENGKTEINWAKIVGAFTKLDAEGHVVTRRTDLKLKNSWNCGKHKRARRNGTWQASRKRKRIQPKSEEMSIKAQDECTENIPSAVIPVLPSIVPLLGTPGIMSANASVGGIALSSSVLYESSNSQQELGKAGNPLILETSKEPNSSITVVRGGDFAFTYPANNSIIVVYSGNPSLTHPENYEDPFEDLEDLEEQPEDSFKNKILALSMPRSHSENSLLGITPRDNGSTSPFFVFEEENLPEDI